MAVFQAAYAGVDVNLEVSGNKIYYVDAGGSPASGTYNAGDLAMVVAVPGGVAPTALSPLFYRCTVAGSPGTWVPIGSGSGGSSFTASVASGTSITPPSTTFGVSGNTQITTIVATGLNAGAQINMIPLDSSTFTTATGGNIALGSTAVRYKVLTMTWDGTAWNPSY